MRVHARRHTRSARHRPRRSAALKSNHSATTRSRRSAHDVADPDDPQRRTARARQRARRHPAADGEGNDAFAQALQRAQGEPKPARSSEPRCSRRSKTGDAHARAAHRAESHGTKPDNAASRRRHRVRRRCGRDRDRARRPLAMPPRGLPRSLAAAASQAAAPGVAIDATMRAATRHRRQSQRMASQRRRRRSCASPSTTAPRSTARAARSGGAHELRAAPSMPARATMPPGEPASARDGAAAPPLHAALERVAADAAAAPTSTTLHAPTFERQAAEPSATPLAARLLPRDDERRRGRRHRIETGAGHRAHSDRRAGLRRGARQRRWRCGCATACRKRACSCIRPNWAR